LLSDSFETTSSHYMPGMKKIGITEASLTSQEALGRQAVVALIGFADRK